MNNKLTYAHCSDYLIPDIQLSYRNDKSLGKYGRMRRAFLEEKLHEVFLRERSAISYCLRRLSAGNCLGKALFFPGR